MNIYSIIIWILVGLIFIFRIKAAYKKGFVRELSDTISLIIAIIIGRMLVSSYHAFVLERLGDAISGIIIVGVVFGIYRLIKIIISALKLFSSLPVIRGLDKILGILAGATEGFFIILFLFKILKIMLV